MDKKIVVGLASFGMSGKVFHAPLLAHHKEFMLKRIVERNRDEARSLYSGIVRTRSLDELLLDPEIELVVVNTPDAFHYEHAKRSLEAGKHVIVEKPITQFLQHANELVDLSRRAGTMLTVFQNRRWDGDFLTVRDVVSGGKLGRIVEFEAHYDRYRTQITPGTWKERADAGTGLLHNLGSHMIDQALVLFGMPEAVTAHIRIIRTGGEVDDWYDVRLHYAGVSAQIRSSYLVRELGPRYTIHGTNGSFLKYGLDPQEEALKQGLPPATPGWGEELEEWWGVLNTGDGGSNERVKIRTRAGNYLAFYDGIFKALRSGAKPPVEPSESVNLMKILEAAQRSNRERRTIELKEEETHR